MIISRLGGITAPSDTALPKSDKIMSVYEADGAIVVGSAVMLDTGNLTGTLVVTGTTATARFVGIYEGLGGTGAETSVTGFSGKAAADGDIIMVTCYGVATARAAAATLVEGDPLTVAAGSTLTVTTAPLPANGSPSYLTCLSLGATYSAGDAIKAHVRAM